MKRSCLVILACSVLSVSVAGAQVVSPVGHGTDLSPTTWSFQLGGSYLGLKESGTWQNFYGWDSSVSEYPYPNLRWLGATIEMSGHYRGDTRTEDIDGTSAEITVNESIYSYMGGPSVAVRSGRVQPFARAMFGAITSHTTGWIDDLRLQQFSGENPSKTHGGMELGGGADFAFSHLLALRTQADWVHEWTTRQATNLAHASAGLVFRF